MTEQLPELTVADAAVWRVWLGQHHGDPHGVWLVLAKKGTAEPTSLGYDQALDEALCHGWIDGQVRRRDETTYRQRFTPRRARNVLGGVSPRDDAIALVAELVQQGRSAPRGADSARDRSGC